MGVEVHHVDRGGEVTYHGPGQLVAYPIVDLRKWGGGPLRYVRALENVIVDTLAELDIEAESSQRPTGVWVGDAKAAAIGVKVSRGVTTHGLALNVCPDLTYFDGIVPCGMPDVLVTSIRVLKAEPVSVDSVTPVLARHFGRVFGWHMAWTTLEELQRGQRHPVPAAPCRQT
jgi:lipoate-protein ligase B